MTQKPPRRTADEPTMVGRPPHRAQPRTAFVLSGGGNQGVAQVGMLRALLEHGIVPDVVVGTSAGALNGAAVAYAPNLTGIAQLEAVWLSLTAAGIFPGGRLSRAWNVVRRGTHLFGDEGLDSLIDRATPARSFADLGVPLRVIATDLDTGEEVVLARGPLKPALLASSALREQLDPGPILARANAEISRDNPESLFITACAGILDADSGELLLANAGHEPALLRASDGAIVRLEPSGEPPLCVLEGFQYATVRRMLEPGEWLCVVTDGVTEAMNERGEMYGAERLARLLAAQRAEFAPAAILAALRDDVRRFVGDTEQSDDLTMLCLRWTGRA